MCVWLLGPQSYFTSEEGNLAGILLDPVNVIRKILALTRQGRTTYYGILVQLVTLRKTTDGKLP